MSDLVLTAQFMRPTWVEFDADAIAHNTRRLKQIVGERVTLMAVVKADGYGHGAVRVAQVALANGAEQLAVANIEEATILREAGISAPILILGYVDPSAVAHCIAHDLAITVYDADLAREHDARARVVGKPLRIHAKIDTGMGRLGMLPSDAAHFLAQVDEHGHLTLEGIYTHFSVADEDPAYTAEQVRVFRDTINGGWTTHASSLRNVRCFHVANSAGTLASADNHFDLVRVGLALYGLSPSDSVPLPPDFRPALTWKTVIASVKTLPPGHVVGYGNTYITQGEERIAVLPVGYADGFRRAPAHYGEVLVRGCRSPIVGRVSMEKTMIRVDHIPNVQIGDEVVLLGKQGSERIAAEDIARRLGTINYEVVCSVLPRVAR
jgi:Alr-MurF fusion protein